MPPRTTDKKFISPAKPKPAASNSKLKRTPALKTRAIAATDPASPKRKRGKTAKPLAPERITAILDALQKAYPNAVCALHHRNAWELVIATILSAQSTDSGVNLATPELFRQFPTPQALAQANPAVVEELIRRTGFFRNKTKSIIGASKVITERFGGKVPQTMDEMLALPGVARKTANVVLGSWYGIPSGVVVDTHVLRLSRRLELTTNTDPVKVEKDLQRVIPQDHWIQFSHELICHGRQVCIARKPQCDRCTLEPLCNSADKTWSSH